MTTRIQPIRSVIIARVKNSKRARKAIADYAAIHGEAIDPNNWKEVLAFLMKLFETLLPLILKFI